MTFLGKLPHTFVGLIFLFSILAMVGCDTGLRDRLTMVENELNETQSELSTVQSELRTTEADLIKVQFDLTDCQINTPAGFGALRITNDNPSYSIWEVYISPITSDVWGEDWTTEFGIVFSGGSSSIYTLDPGTYDVLVVFSEGTEFQEQVTIQAGKEASLRYF